MIATREARFKQAAWCYLAYGVAYWLGGVYLAAHGIGGGRGLVWVALGLVFVALFPWLIARGSRGRGFLWFVRVLSVAVLLRAILVARTVVEPRLPSVPLPGGGVLPMRVAATLFLVITLATAAMLARAAWSRRSSVL
ncbi:MAG: hypothetical protein HYY95_21670 [Candidatus Rokubacteria bacterium]|nr:hypothetical protein [Candidatus Rokubacteria bacterium]MBI3108146.1 hypothetical protein [Candidatus Rokubacteria bacterium]